MIKKQDVEKLAELSRIALDEDELGALAKDLDSIVEYVSLLDTFDTSDAPSMVQTSEMLNVVREDVDPHETGLYTKRILAEAPVAKDGYVKVKKILSNE